MGTSYLPDEADPRRPMLPGSSTSQQALKGGERGMTSPAQAGEYPSVLPLNITYTPDAISRGVAMGSAGMAAFLLHEPDVKIAESEQVPVRPALPTFTGMEHVQAQANTAGFRLVSRGPFASNPPPQTSIKSKLASSPAAPFDNSDQAVMALLMDY